MCLLEALEENHDELATARFFKHKGPIQGCQLVVHRRIVQNVYMDRYRQQAKRVVFCIIAYIQMFPQQLGQTLYTPPGLPKRRVFTSSSLYLGPILHGVPSLIIDFDHFRVNFWPAITGTAEVDFEFAFPHMAHAGPLSVQIPTVFERGIPTICFVCAFLAICAALIDFCLASRARA
jgi:hypothetical protein